MQCRYNEYVNLVPYKNYWNKAEKPQQNTVKKNNKKQQKKPQQQQKTTKKNLMAPFNG